MTLVLKEFGDFLQEAIGHVNNWCTVLYLSIFYFCGDSGRRLCYLFKVGRQEVEQREEEDMQNRPLSSGLEPRTATPRPLHTGAPIFQHLVVFLLLFSYKSLCLGYDTSKNVRWMLHDVT
ncbi:hypothetical protein ATANTOWER_003461 [Ataeniobius toweri]|uniref:Uncharacterized protein n=1 Tax=Ataeniobius toweri TaxID=208326 RepID=A0ABU7BQI7_9TELE|nr:hypothetical protein [Ataeniobius toweri]